MFTFPTLAGPGVRLGVVVAALVFLLAACASGGTGGSSGYGSSGSSGSTASPGSASATFRKAA